MQSPISIITALFLLFSISIATANSPNIKLYPVPYNTSKLQCKKDITAAFVKAGYVDQIKAFESETFIATKDGYRAALSCISPNTSNYAFEVDRIIIVVAGDKAEAVQNKAVALVDLLSGF